MGLAGAIVGIMIVMLASMRMVRWIRYCRRTGRKVAPRSTWFILAGAAVVLIVFIVFLAPLLAGKK